MSNYRPISLLSIFSKLFETIVAARLSNYLQKYNLLYDFQFGFRSGCSTKLALINSVDDILTHLDKRLFSAGIFIDFSKAFDSLDHSILLKKLEKFGIRGHLFKWFSSYLPNRCQYTYVNDTASVTYEIKYGVPHTLKKKIEKKYTTKM